jgi:hypothetical protein
MANAEHLAWLRKGAKKWNAWRQQTGLRRPDLVEADLRQRNLRGANLRGALMVHARLSNAKLDDADFRGADLRAASLRQAQLWRTDFTRANLRHANLSGADVSGALFTDCQIFGAGLWQLVGAPGDTARMRICQSLQEPPPPDSPELLADSLDSAQFMYLLLDNPRIAGAFDALGRRIVLILGRFADGNLDVLLAMKQRLMAGKHFLPIVFDFAGPVTRSLTEAVAGFAHLAYFVVADLSDAKSLPQELSAIVPFLPSVPVVPLLREGQHEYAMFEHFQRYPWVLDIVHYRNVAHLLEIFDERVRDAGRDRAEQLRRR